MVIHLRFVRDDYLSVVLFNLEGKIGKILMEQCFVEFNFVLFDKFLPDKTVLNVKVQISTRPGTSDSLFPYVFDDLGIDTFGWNVNKATGDKNSVRVSDGQFDHFLQPIFLGHAIVVQKQN